MKIPLAGLILLLVSVVATPRISAQSASSTPAPSAAGPAPGNTILLTVFMRHDQTKTLDEINAHLDKSGFRKNFPPEGVEIVSYNIVMGIGQVITLRLPPEKLRAVNLAFEKGAWGAFRTEFYATYDYLPVIREQNAKDATAK